MGKISTYDLDVSPAAADYIIAVKASTGGNVRIKLDNIAALVSSDDWLSISGLSYSSWDSTNKTGIIATTSDHTATIQPGSRIRLNQTTGGDKYAIVTAITSSTITAYFGTDYTLNSETINSSDYSNQKAPIGFPLNPNKWTVVVSSTSNRSTTNTSLSSLTDAITVPIGVWRLSLKCSVRFIKTGGAGRSSIVTLSGDSSTETDPEFTTANASSQSSDTQQSTSDLSKNVVISSAKTYLLMGSVSAGSTTVLVDGNGSATYLRATCAYL